LERQTPLPNPCPLLDNDPIKPIELPDK
jgi:hypothetical protein